MPRRRRPPAARPAPRRPKPRAAPKPRPSRFPGAPDSRLVDGINLYNHHQYYAAHDTIEQLWLATRGPERDFYRGLIQAAVACYHWSRGNRRGAMTLFRSSSRHLKKYRPDCFGVDVAGFLQRYTELFNWLRRHRTRYDARLVPTLTWNRTPV